MSTSTAISVQPAPLAPAAAQSDDVDDPNEPVNNFAPETDKNGLRWDARIHASSKALTADGSWRMQRGIEKKLGAPAIAAIEAELRGAAPSMPAAPVAPPQMPQAPAMPVTPPAPGMPAAPVQPTQPPQVPQNAVFPNPNIPPEALAPPAPAPQPVAAGMPFNEFMPLLGRMMQPHPANSVTYVDQPYLASLCQYLGVENITQIAAAPDKIAMAVDKLKADQRWWVT